MIRPYQDVLKEKETTELTESEMKVWHTPQLTQLDVEKTRGGTDCTKEESEAFNLRICS